MVAFRIDEQTFALPLTAVLRVLRAMEITPLPGAPAIVLGIVNVAGEVFPVMNLRRRLGFPERPVKLTDELILARTERRNLALLVDSGSEVLPSNSADIVSTEQIVPGLEHVRGILRMPDGLVLIQDLERFLSLEEEKALNQALEERA